MSVTLDLAPSAYVQTAVPAEQVSAVQENIARYLAARDAFNAKGGQDFLIARRQVRDVYCDANVSSEAIDAWISSLPNEDVQAEFAGRFKEWNGKIARGLITKSETPGKTEEQFFQVLQDYYNNHREFLEGSVFVEFNEAKSNLRQDLLPYLKSEKVDEVAQQFGIQDEELISRMTTEWSWKA